VAQTEKRRLSGVCSPQGPWPSRTHPTTGRHPTSG